MSLLKPKPFCELLVALFGLAVAAGADDLHTFKRIQLSDQFWSGGANFGDLNNDGVNDLVSGPWWQEGPDFKKRHEFYPSKTTFQLKLGPMTNVTVPLSANAGGTEFER